MAPLRQRDASDCIQTVLKRTIHCWHLSVFWSLSYLFQDETSLTYFSSNHQYLTFQKVMLDWFPSFLPSFQAVIAFLFISKQLSLMKRSSCELFLSQRFNLTKKQKISVSKKLERDEEKSVHSSSKSSVCHPSSSSSSSSEIRRSLYLFSPPSYIMKHWVLTQTSLNLLSSPQTVCRKTQRKVWNWFLLFLQRRMDITQP